MRNGPGSSTCNRFGALFHFWHHLARQAGGGPPHQGKRPTGTPLGALGGRDRSLPSKGRMIHLIALLSQIHSTGSTCRNQGGGPQTRYGPHVAGVELGRPIATTFLRFRYALYPIFLGKHLGRLCLSARLSP